MGSPTTHLRGSSSAPAPPSGGCQRVGPVLLTVLPFVVMFVVTSVATLRERTSGTLERLLTTPLGRADLVLGYALAFGLLASACAATEFQPVQLMPATVLPQFLLCALLVPRDQLPRALELVFEVLPLSYVVDAATSVARAPEPGGDLVTPLLVIAGWIVVALALGSLTLRRRTG